MKQFIALLICILLLTGCAPTNRPPTVVNTVKTSFTSYEKLSDGTWRHDGYIYQYRLEISGRMPNAVKDSTFVYLSNLETISFQRAYMAAGLSSNLEDYFTAEEAVLVDWITE